MGDRVEQTLDATDVCFICGDLLDGVDDRSLTVLGTLKVEACGACVDLPDTAEFINRLLIERLRPR